FFKCLPIVCQPSLLSKISSNAFLSRLGPTCFAWKNREPLLRVLGRRHLEVVPFDGLLAVAALEGYCFWIFRLSGAVGDVGVSEFVLSSRDPDGLSVSLPGGRNGVWRCPGVADAPLVSSIG